MDRFETFHYRDLLVGGRYKRPVPELRNVRVAVIAEWIAA